VRRPPGATLSPYTTLFRSGQALDADRAAVELLDHGQQQAAVEMVEAARVDAEHVQRGVGDFGGDDSVGFHLGVVAYATQQSIGEDRKSRRLNSSHVKISYA